MKPTPFPFVSISNADRILLQSSISHLSNLSAISTVKFSASYNLWTGVMDWSFDVEFGVNVFKTSGVF